MNATKKKLIAAGAELFCIHSYQGTGINDILKACGVPKGSFYNHFASKEDFALAVVEFHREATCEFLTANLCNEALGPLERIGAYIDAFNQDVVDSCFSVGCPLGTMAQEMACLSEPLRTALTAVFQMQVDALADCVRLGQKSGVIAAEIEPVATAMFIMSSLEGSQIMAKTYQSAEPLHGSRHFVMDVLLAASRA